MTLAPVVPLAADIGMLNSLGYSVANLGAGNVKENKSVYFVSTDSWPGKAAQPLTLDADKLYSATTLLNQSVATSLESELFPS